MVSQCLLTSFSTPRVLILADIPMQNRELVCPSWDNNLKKLVFFHTLWVSGISTKYLPSARQNRWQVQPVALPVDVHALHVFNAMSVHSHSA